MYLLVLFVCWCTALHRAINDVLFALCARLKIKKQVTATRPLLLAILAACIHIVLLIVMKSLVCVIYNVAMMVFLLPALLH